MILSMKMSNCGGIPEDRANGLNLSYIRKKEFRSLGCQKVSLILKAL